MKKPFIIAWDKDLTLSDGFTGWLDWLNLQLPESERITFECVTGRNGDLVPYFKERGITNPFEYWMQHDLYDDLEPFGGERCAEIITRLGDYVTNLTSRPVEHIVVSRCVPEHVYSKRRFIDKHFAGVFSGFIDTAQKQYTRCDAMFDDSVDTLKLMRGTGVKLVVPATHNVYDFSKEDPNYVKSMGVQGVMGSMWDQLMADETEVTKLGIWLAEGLR